MRRQGLPEDEVADTFHTALLVHVGGSTLSQEPAVVFGDERPVLSAVARTNVADPADIAATLLPEVTWRMSSSERSRIEHYTATRGRELGRRFDTGNCEVASATAKRVGRRAGPLALRR